MVFNFFFFNIIDMYNNFIIVNKLGWLLGKGFKFVFFLVFMRFYFFLEYIDIEMFLRKLKLNLIRLEFYVIIKVLWLKYLKKVKFIVV